jgi:hypothetical protein
VPSTALAPKDISTFAGQTFDFVITLERRIRLLIAVNTRRGDVPRRSETGQAAPSA